MITQYFDVLQSARRRIAVLYMAGIGGEAAELDLRLAIDELDSFLGSGDATGLVIRRSDFAAIHEVLWYGLLPQVPLNNEAHVRLIAEHLLACLADRMKDAS